MFAPSGGAQTLPGTVLSNTAELSYSFNAAPVVAPSNTVDVTVLPPRTSAVLDIIKVTGSGGESVVLGATSCTSGGAAVTLPPAVLLNGTVVTPGSNQSVVTGALLHAGEPLFVRVTDPDQNLDGLAVETLTVTLEAGADTEIIELTETAANSGEFTGYVPTAAPPVTASDCTLQIDAGGALEVRYQDPRDPADSASGGALVDPLGIVFDSRTGQPLDGAIVTLIDVSTGLPATVLGDDGLSAYPAQVTTGGSVTDSGGTLYQFAPGQFRFPLIAPGTYRLDVQPPAGYSAPSSATIADLQALPGAPFALEPASFGDVFVVSPGPVINIDLPVDPTDVALFVQKTLMASDAAPGDFLAYTVTVDNGGSGVARDVSVSDSLPVGFRLVGGSVRIDGAPADDPSRGATASELTFVLGDLGPGAQRTLRYVVEVTTAARGREAVNVAQARSTSGEVSNVARASVALRDDFFGDQAILIGRVIDGSCDDDVANDVEGVQNVRIYLEDGRYAVTDEGGRYHFEGVTPGNHVVQLDVDTVPRHMEIVACEVNSRFAGRAYSQFVDLQPSSLWRADFYLREIPPPNGALTLNLEGSADGDRVDYTLLLTGEGVPVEKLKALVMLPDGARFVPGTVRIGGSTAADPAVTGQALSFALGARDGVWSDTIEFEAELPQAATGEAVTKAVATFDTPSEKRMRTPLADTRFVREPGESQRFERQLTPRFATRSAELNAEDRQRIADLVAPFAGAGKLQVRAVGHTDNVRIAPQNRHEFADNYALSEARARAVARYVSDLLGLPPSQVTLAGRGPDEPLADNASAAGRARNRRVQLMIWGEQVTRAGTLRAAKPSSGMQRVDTQGLSPAREEEQDPATPAAEQTDWYASNDWLDDATPEPEWLLPALDENPAIPSLQMVVKHGPRQQAKMWVNGQAVSPLNFDGVTRSANGEVAVSRWRGVDIPAGESNLELRIYDDNDAEIARLTRTVHFAGGPVRAEIDPEASRLVADGRTRPLIVLRVFDRAGRPARPDSIGVFHVDPPYRSQWEVDAARDNAQIVVGDRDPVYSVTADGTARIELEPTSRSGEVLLTLRFENERTQEVRAWLEPAARDWILVGLAEGTVGFNNISDNVVEAAGNGIEENYYTDGRLAFFAKGRVRGEYLLTLAYDTDRDREEAEARLFGQIDPDRFYTLYGDATEQRFDAASQEKLYLKIERGQFYALFGDYQTNMTVTELSRYNRSFNGLKSEYHGDRFGLNLFGTRTDQAFVKDEIRGDGTSGLYRLSRRPVIVNSERIAIEVRDRFRSEEIVELRTLTRHLDYDIDYLNGTLFFKQPVPSRDQNFNQVYIVADYESRDSGDEETTWGARATVAAGERVTVGASAVSEGTAGGEGELYGVDVVVKVSDVTELRAEAASTEVSGGTGDRDGDAWLVSLRHEGEKMDGQVYAREQDQDFGLGQQRASEGGTRKLGFDGRLRFTRTLQLGAEAFRQENLDTAAVRDVAEAQLRYQKDGRTLTLGLRSARDEDASGAERESSQAFAQASVTTLGDRLTLRMGTELSLGDDAQNPDYPDRTTVGVDYRVHDRFSVFAEHETGRGEAVDTQNTRIGVRATPWERAQINASVNQAGSEYGPRVFANVGLVQGWQLNDRWTLDVGLDQSNTISAPGVIPFDDDVPPASGSDGADFTAFWLGALYRGDFWSATGRLEHRNSDLEERLGLFFGVHREQTEGIGFTADGQIFDSDTLSGADTFDADVRLGWAFRPADSRWVVFDRLDLRYRDLATVQDDTTTWKLINNFSANYAITRHSQLALRYGAKFTRADVAGDEYTGFTDLIGVAWRHDLSERFDLGLHAGLRHSWRADVYDYSVGVEGGVTLLDNMWLSLGYNFQGFEDDDFRASGYYAQGPYLRLRLKADQDTLSGLMRRLPVDKRRRPRRRH